MEIVSSSKSYYENLTRYWRRRRYQKLSGGYSNNSKRTFKYARLGGDQHGSPINRRRRSWKIRIIPKLRVLKQQLVSPLKLLAKFHEAYVDMMMSLAEKRVAKDKQICMVSTAATHELVDSKLVLEIYKRLAASRSLSSSALIAAA